MCHVDVSDKIHKNIPDLFDKIDNSLETSQTLDNDLKVISAQLKNEQNNIEGRFVNLKEGIEEIKNRSNKHLVNVEKTLSDTKDEILDRFMEINSTSLKKFSEIDHAVKIFGEELKTDKDEVRSEIVSLNRSFTNEIFLLNKSLTNEVNLNRNISKKTEKAVAFLVNIQNTTRNPNLCKDGWSQYENDCFQISTSASAWTRTMCIFGKVLNILTHSHK